MTTSNTPPTKNKPTHIAFHVRDNASKEPFWNRIGCAWAHKDGEGLFIQLETVPLNGRITLRVAAKPD